MKWKVGEYKLEDEHLFESNSMLSAAIWEKDYFDKTFLSTDVGKYLGHMSCLWDMGDDNHQGNIYELYVKYELDGEMKVRLSQVTVGGSYGSNMSISMCELKNLSVKEYNEIAKMNDMEEIPST